MNNREGHADIRLSDDELRTLTDSEVKRIAFKSSFYVFTLPWLIFALVMVGAFLYAGHFIEALIVAVMAYFFLLHGKIRVVDEKKS